jgi:hypothetical protein
MDVRRAILVGSKALTSLFDLSHEQTPALGSVSRLWGKGHRHSCWSDRGAKKQTPPQPLIVERLGWRACSREACRAPAEASYIRHSAPRGEPLPARRSAGFTELSVTCERPLAQPHFIS